MTDSRPEAPARLRTVLAPLFAGHRIRLAVVASTSLFGGFAEAAVLVVIARVAFAITQQDGSVSVTAGPIGPYEISVPTLIVIAGLLTAVRLVLQAVTAWQAATLTSIERAA